ncbi:MAG: choice-of-anchor A family protein, partial [Lawsonibacter sp.]
AADADADAASGGETGPGTESTSNAAADADAETVSGMESTSDAAAGIGAEAGTELPIDGSAQIQEEIQPAEYACDDGNGLAVMAVPQDPASIPEGAEFHADRITQESDPDRYAQLQQLLEAEGGFVNSTDFRAYDIYFLVNDQRVEPDGSTVDVTIVDTTDAAIAPEDAQVFHVLNEDTDPALQKLEAEPLADSSASVESADSLDTADAEQSITFTTESFSAYLVTGDTMSSNLSYLTYPETAPEYTSTQYYDASRPLDIAGNFHIVAFDSATMTAHTNGNLLANTVSAGANFGTSDKAGVPITDELSYIQKYIQVNSGSGSSASHVLALGDQEHGNIVSLTDGGSSFTIKNTFSAYPYDAKLDTPHNIWQDSDTSANPFIDLSEVKAQMEELSASLAEAAGQNISADLFNTGTQTKSGLTLTDPNGLGIYNTTANDLQSYGYCNIFGLTFNNDYTALTGGTVIVNVDCSEWNKSNAFTMPECKIYSPLIDDPYADPSKTVLPFEQVANFTNGRVLWNFVNSDGMTIYTKLTYASILAPGANVVVTQNLNGTIICDNLTNNSAETHRDDFIGELPQPPFSYTVSKVWKDINGNVLTDTDLTGLSVTVELRDGSGALVGTETLSSANNWTYTWSDLDRSKTYTAVETVVYLDGDTSNNRMDQYTSTSSDSDGGCTITNSPKTLPFELPDTGGPGTYLYTAAGLSLLVPSCLLLFGRWNRHRRDDS